MPYLIDVKTLNHKLQENKEELVLIDVRFSLANDRQGEDAYNQSHLPGAYYLHIEKDLSGEVKKHGGNHPLPDPQKLTEKLSEIGVTNDKVVVIYDAGNDMFAPRAWWLLHYLGHDQCYVLEGGFNEWVNQGYPVTSDVPEKKKTTFIANIRPNLTVDINEVKEKVTSKEAYLIDSRARDRYLGRTEPLYSKSGHIPGAKNYFWGEVLDGGGSWKNETELQQHFKQFDIKDEIIVSCGSGISACPNILALKMLGFKNVKLYPGSFSDWISYEENEIATEKDLVEKGD